MGSERDSVGLSRAYTPAIGRKPKGLVVETLSFGGKYTIRIRLDWAPVCVTPSRTGQAL